MKKRVTLAAANHPQAGIRGAARIVEGLKLPAVEVVEKGVMVPCTRIEGRKMVMDGHEITYRPWKLSDSDGRVRTIYHLAARLGIEEVNKAAIEVLRTTKLPELVPNAPYKTITIVNFDEALWGTRGMALARMENKQRDHPHAVFVADEKGHARKAWGLKPGQTSVIILDRKGTILFFKEGKLSPEEVRLAVGLVHQELKST